MNPRYAHSLIELMVAMAAASMLLGGLGSTIWVARHAIDDGNSGPVQTIAAEETIEEAMANLHYATNFSERAATAVTFQSPDHDGDEADDTMRLAWSGTPGDPLTLEYNGAAPAIVAEDVQSLNLQYNYRTVTGAGFAKGVINDETLVGHWKFNELLGNVAVDASQYGNDGTLLNGAKRVSGSWGRGIDFDGNNDYILVPHNSVLALTKTFTLMAWVWGDAGSFSGGFRTVVQKGTSGNNANYWLATFGDEVDFGFYNKNYYYFETSGKNLNTETWHHIVATYDDGAVILYLNGIQVYTGSQNKSPLANSDALTIGKTQHGEYWKGNIDEIRIYNRALPAAEILMIMNERQ